MADRGVLLPGLDLSFDFTLESLTALQVVLQAIRSGGKQTVDELRTSLRDSGHLGPAEALAETLEFILLADRVGPGSLVGEAGDGV